MGIIYQKIRLSNPARKDLEELDPKALVDTGALDLCIPDRVAKQLRLDQFDERQIVLADGSTKLVPYVGGVMVEVFGRKAVISACVVGDEVLLGAFPMEVLDLVVHPRSMTLGPNPEHPNVPASLAKGVCQSRKAD